MIIKKRTDTSESREFWMQIDKLCVTTTWWEDRRSPYIGDSWWEAETELSLSLLLDDEGSNG